MMLLFLCSIWGSESVTLDLPSDYDIAWRRYDFPFTSFLSSYKFVGVSAASLESILGTAVYKFMWKKSKIDIYNYSSCI